MKDKEHRCSLCGKNGSQECGRAECGNRKRVTARINSGHRKEVVNGEGVYRAIPTMDIKYN